MFCGISGLFGSRRVAVPFNNLISAVCAFRLADIYALSCGFAFPLSVGFAFVVFVFGVVFLGLIVYSL